MEQTVELEPIALRLDDVNYSAKSPFFPCLKNLQTIYAKEYYPEPRFSLVNISWRALTSILIKGIPQVRAKLGL